MQTSKKYFWKCFFFKYFFQLNVTSPCYIKCYNCWKVVSHMKGYTTLISSFFTCVALAKAGLVVGLLCPSGGLTVRSFVCLFVRPSVCPSATLLGCLVCVICNSNSFHSFSFKLCLMIVHTLKMCTFYFVHNWYIFSHFLRVLNLDIFSIRNA